MCTTQTARNMPSNIQYLQKTKMLGTVLSRIQRKRKDGLYSNQATTIFKNITVYLRQVIKDITEVKLLLEFQPSSPFPLPDQISLNTNVKTQ